MKQPATPLSLWSRDQYGNVNAAGSRLLVTGVALNTGHHRQEAQDNIDYLYHAAMAYPRLIYALKQAHIELQWTDNDKAEPIAKLLHELGER